MEILATLRFAARALASGEFSAGVRARPSASYPAAAPIRPLVTAPSRKSGPNPPVPNSEGAEAAPLEKARPGSMDEIAASTQFPLNNHTRVGITIGLSVLAGKEKARVQRGAITSKSTRRSLAISF